VRHAADPALTALECGLDTVLPPRNKPGGMAALRTQVAGAHRPVHPLVEERCAGPRPGLATPRDHAQRGSQVCLSRDEGAYAIVQALIAAA
jgi:kynureninase